MNYDEIIGMMKAEEKKAFAEWKSEVDYWMKKGGQFDCKNREDISKLETSAKARGRFNAICDMRKMIEQMQENKN